ncbi:MAG: peptide deformylase [Patescibacteria group bacterium]
MKDIVQKEEKVLREVAKEVPIKDICTPKIKKILKEMEEALKSQSDGVAIAAPQIGYSLRIFLVSGKIFEDDFMKKEEPHPNPLLNKEREPKEIKHLVFINPKISKLSREKKWLPEGCLSVRWLYGKTYRSIKATAEAYDENGKKFTRGASGLLAQIFQHETDHLNGILFIDHAKEVKEEKPQK